MEGKSVLTPKLKIVIGILVALMVLSTGALAARIIYLNVIDKGDTVVVPDNLIGQKPDANTTTVGQTDVTAESTTAPPETTTALTETTVAPETNTPSENSPSNPSPAPAVTTAPIPSEEVRAATISLYKGQPDDNERFKVENMFPGDTEVRYYQVKVNHRGEISLFFKAEVTEQTKALGDVLNIKITHLETGKVLYDGTFNNMSADGYSELLPKSSTRETTAYYKIEVSLPTSVGNEHQAAMLEADFHWYVKDEGELEPPPTGDNSNIVLWTVLGASSAALILLLILVRRKKDEDEEEDYAD